MVYLVNGLVFNKLGLSKNPHYEEAKNSFQSLLLGY